ncbi:MAG: orotidine-5'-phosphate decarboxylase [Microbacteriaceae bacterium]|nr:orotidine-5'-phosphate decarboxylase [Microbacteriaceae bacterium]
MTASVAAAPSTVAPFGSRLAAAFDARGQLCVGIDPHPYLLNAWGLTDDAAGLTDFGLRVVDASVGYAGIVKPQVAFFERHGSAGFLALEQVLSAARAAGLLIIADAKRGDVGTSVEAYGQAWFQPGSPLEADALTVSAFQGVQSLAAPIALAAASGKGLFVLAATSNPESEATQTAIISRGPRAGHTVAAGIVADVVDENQNQRTDGSSPDLGSLGVVLGATVNFTDYGINLDSLAGNGVATPILAPGFGHQGAEFEQLGALYGAASALAIVSVSRSILTAGPHEIAGAIAVQAKAVFQWRG